MSDQNYDNMNINLDEVEESKGFELLPKGDYDAIVADVEFEVSQNSGNPMLVWKMELTDPQHNKRKFNFYTVLSTDLGKAQMKATLAALGLPISGGFNPKTFAEQGQAINLPCRVKLGHNKYQGETRNNVKEVLPLVGGQVFGSASSGSY